MTSYANASSESDANAWVFTVCFVPNSGHHSVFSAWLHAYLALADLS